MRLRIHHHRPHQSSGCDKGGRSTLIAWIAQTFLQLVLLSIIMVGQKVAAAGSDKQLQQTYDDAEALLQITDEMHKLLKQNTSLTEKIDQLLCKTHSEDQTRTAQ